MINHENVQEIIKQGYFAAKPATEAASDILDKCKSFYNLMESNQYLDKLNKMWRAYYGTYGGDDGHEVSFTGEQGELVQLPVNHFRNIAQNMHIMITGNRPIMEARALNTDYKSLSQTYLAQGILEYYMRERHLEDALKKAAELAVVMGAGYIKLEWNATAGEAYDYDEETKQFNYEGDLDYTVLSPFDVVFDGTKESQKDNTWFVTRTFKNKFDLIAKFPEQAEKIKTLSTKSDYNNFRMVVWSNDKTDDVPVYEFFHKKTESMPEGRYIMFLDSDVILMDIPLPYRTIPLFRIAASDILGTPYGYTPMFDIYPLQEVVNSTFSGITTNQNAFLIQSLFVPIGSGLEMNTFGEGMNVYQGTAKPEPIQLTATPKEAFDFLNLLVQSMETLSAVNSVVRGNPEASLKSGTALALVQSQALQFMSGLQQSYVKLIEDTGSSIIQILKDFAAAPRVIAIVGKNNRPLLKEFTGESVSSINRVVVDVGNALSRTTSGRVQMAEQLLQMKLLRSPEQYFQVLNTGRLDMAYEGDMMELLLIKDENEQMLNGEVPLVSPVDQHSLHIREHKAVLANPELRKDPVLAKVVMDHIEMHLNALRNTDPGLLQQVGEAPLPPIEQMLGQQGTPGQDGQPTQQSLNGSPMQDVMQNAPQGSIQGGSIENPMGENLPNLPNVPAENLISPELQEASMGNVSQ